MPNPPRLERLPRERLPSLNPVPVTGIPDAVAVDRAVQESVGLGDMSQFIPSLDGNLKDSGFLLDATRQIYSDIASKNLQEAFVIESRGAQNEQELLSVISKYEGTINKQSADARTLLMLNYLQTVPPDLYDHDSYNFYKQEFVTPEGMDRLRLNSTTRGLEELRHTLDEYMAGKDLSSVTEAVVEVGRAALQPFQENVLNDIAREAGAPLGMGSIALSGFGRQEIRDWLVNLPEEEKQTFATNLVNLLKEKERDPIQGMYIADFAVGDFMSNVLSDEVLQGKASKDNLDIWLNNVVSVLDVLWLTGAVARVAGKSTRGMRGLLSNRTTRPTIRRANSISTPTSSNIINTIRSNKQVSDTLKVEQEETIAASLPVPEDMLDNMVAVPEQVRSIQDELAVRRSQVITQADSNARNFVPEQKQFEIRDAEVTALANASSGKLMPQNSSLGIIGENEGFRVHATIGANEVSGWKGSAGLTDVLNVIQDFDPVAVRLSVLTKREDGTLRVLYDVPQSSGATKYLPHFEAELARIAGLERPGMTENAEFFIRATRERLWTPEEKMMFGTNPVVRSGLVTDILQDAPNYRFAPEVYDTSLHGYSIEQNVASQMTAMLDPVFKLPDVSKRAVFSTYEWTNEFAKTSGRNPKMHEIQAAFPDLTGDELAAMYSLRYAQDTWHMVLNKRLYRNWQGQGFVTGSSSWGTMPRYHGRLVDESSVIGKSHYDPGTRTLRQLSAEEARELYSGGGGVLQLDMPLDLPTSTRIKYDRVIVSKGQGYSVEALHHNVLDYHPGYFIKMYEDQWLIVKRYNKVNVNGEELNVKSHSRDDGKFSTAIRTANSLGRARRLVERYNTRLSARKADYTYDVVSVRDLSLQDKSAQLGNLLNREGRLFYDTRDYTLLKDLDGNRAEFVDPVLGLEKAIGAVARQVGMEDPIRSMKLKFREQYRDLFAENEWMVLNTEEVRSRIKSALETARQGSDARLKKRLKEALDLWDYIRMLDGVDSDLFSSLKITALDVAASLNRGKGIDGKLMGAIERGIANAAPVQLIRSATFKAMLVTRPVRQLLLQSMQILFLAPIAPKYIYSGKILLDGSAVRIGVAKLKGLDSDWSNVALAKTMGLSEKEFNLVIRQLDKSGLLQHVDVHAFAGGSRISKGVKVSGSFAGEMAGAPAKAMRRTMTKLQQYGFDLGERNNLAFTYVLAMRRYLEKNELAKVGDISLEGWDTIRNDASNLAMGMTRVNQLKYQQGMLSLATQFLSFSHKAMLTMLGRNPAISKTEALRIFAINTFMYGGAMFGAKEQVQGWLDSMEANKTLSPKGYDYMSSILGNGLIETVLNATGKHFVDDWKDLNFEGFAPGVGGITTFYKNLVDAVTGVRTIPFFFGPSGTWVGNVIPGIATATAIYSGDADMPAHEKFLASANEIISGMAPGYNDINQAYQAWQLGQWYAESGQNTDVKAVWNTLIAKGLVNINSTELNTYWTIRGNEAARKTQIQDRVQADKVYIQRIINRYGQGLTTLEGLVQAAILRGNWTSNLPEEDQALYYNMMNNAEIGGFSMNQYISELMTSGYFDKGTGHLIDKLESMEPSEREAAKWFIDAFYSELNSANEFRRGQLEVFELENRTDGN